MPGTVTVACKTPNGVHLDVYEPASLKPVSVNGHPEIRPVVRGRITLNGNAAARRLESNFQTTGETGAVVGGYGLTHNVDADLWELAKAQGKGTSLFENGLVFAHEKPAEVVAEARDNAERRAPLAPLNPDKPAPGIEKAKEAYGEKEAA